MRLLTLIKMQLKVAFGLSVLKSYASKDKKKLFGFLGIALLVIISVAPMYFYLYLNILRSIYDAGLMFGQPQILLTLAFVFTSMMVLVLGIGYVMSAFYFSRDLPVLLPLPFLPREIIGAKFFTILVHEYLSVLPFLLPAFMIFGLGQNVGLYYWVVSIIVFLLLPVIPLTITSSVMLVLMRVTNLGRRKDTLRFFGMVFFIGLVMVANYYLAKLPGDMDAEFFQKLLLQADGMVSLVGRVFPPALLATRSLTTGGMDALTSLLAFVALNLAGLAFTMFLGDRLFYQGLIGGEEVQARKNMNESQLEKKLSRTGSPIKAIAAREIKILIRTPIYLFNSVAMLIILPVVLLIPVISGQNVAGISDLIQSMPNRAFLNLAGAAFIAMMALFTPAASSAFSREGRLFWVSQVIPVSPRDQINGKLLYSYLIVCLTVPLIVLISILFINWSRAELLLVIFLGLCFSLPAITTGLLIDLLRPYLTWDSPQKAIKQNINVILGMVVGVGIFFLIYRVLLWAQNLTSALWLYTLAAGAGLVLGLVPYLIMLKVADARFRDIMAP